MLQAEKCVRSARLTNDPKISGRASTITVKWQAENAEDRLRSATMADGRQGWFEIQMDRSPNGLGHRRKLHKVRRTDKPGDCIAIPTAAALSDQERHELTAEASLRKTSLNSKVSRLEKQISSLSRRDETPSSTTGPNEIIDDCFWISYDYQELSSKIGRAGRLLALLGLPLSSNAEEWLRLRLLVRGGTRIARWR
jgi:hypothetical protein